MELKTEADGRMFPVTDDSATVVDCLMHAAQRAGVRLFTGCGLRGLEKVPGDGRGRFMATLSKGERVIADRVLIATGGGKDSAGLAVAALLGHGINPRCPRSSRFTWTIRALKGLRASRQLLPWSRCLKRA